MDGADAGAVQFGVVTLPLGAFGGGRGRVGEALAHCLPHPVAHLVGRLASERNGHDASQPVPERKQFEIARDERARLAGARARGHQGISRGALQDAPLLVVRSQPLYDRRQRRARLRHTRPPTVRCVRCIVACHQPPKAGR